jgi:hypothetical protein
LRWPSGGVSICKSRATASASRKDKVPAIRPPRTFRPELPSSKFGRAFARRAVKVDAVLGSANPKALGNDIRFYIERGSRLRKLGDAGVFAPRALKDFNPMVGICHLAIMPLKSVAIKPGLSN